MRMSINGLSPCVSQVGPSKMCRNFRLAVFGVYIYVFDDFFIIFYSFIQDLHFFRCFVESKVDYIYIYALLNSKFHYF